MAKFRTVIHGFNGFSNQETWEHRNKILSKYEQFSAPPVLEEVYTEALEYIIVNIKLDYLENKAIYEDDSFFPLHTGSNNFRLYDLINWREIAEDIYEYSKYTIFNDGK